VIIISNHRRHLLSTLVHRRPSPHIVIGRQRGPSTSVIDIENHRRHRHPPLSLKTIIESRFIVIRR